MATYSCDAGYGLVGDLTRVCVCADTWSEPEPTCEASEGENDVQYCDNVYVLGCNINRKCSHLLHKILASSGIVSYIYTHAHTHT